MPMVKFDFEQERDGAMLTACHLDDDEVSSCTDYGHRIKRSRLVAKDLSKSREVLSGDEVFSTVEGLLGLYLEEEPEAAAYYVIYNECLNAMLKESMFNKHKKHLNIKKSNIHGVGVFTDADIDSGEFLSFYPCDDVEVEHGDFLRKAGFLSHDEEKGFRAYSYETPIGTIFGDKHSTDKCVAHIVNHSDDPNCKYVCNHGLAYLFSIKDIEAGEELTVDYGTDALYF